ncbi:MAG: carbamoyl phosphate synthase, partial [Candidatus Ornithomonoglobus sp.]
MNILVLSCGTRNKVMQYFKRELKGKGKLFATDCSELAPALYEADKYFIVPRMTDDNYLSLILDICKDNKIDAVFSLIDPELSLLAENREKFLA